LGLGLGVVMEERADARARRRRFSSHRGAGNRQTGSVHGRVGGPTLTLVSLLSLSTPTLAFTHPPITYTMPSMRRLCRVAEGVGGQVRGHLSILYAHAAAARHSAESTGLAADVSVAIPGP
jgi:hypothetical protein